MKLRFGGRTYRGCTIDLRDTHPDVDPDRIRRAVGLDGDDALAVVTDSPASLYQLLASAARARGHEPPQADRIVTLRRRLDEAEPTGASSGASNGEPNLAAPRQRAAEAAADVDRLRERVATARGRLQAVREAEEDVTAAEEAHERAARELTAAETDRVAAVQALAAACDRVRDRRADSREALRLRDELANRRREARCDLAERVYDEFAAAVERLPGDADPGSDASAFAGDRVTAHLAAVAVADREDPVVLAVARFEDPDAARRALGVPVVQV